MRHLTPLAVIVLGAILALSTMTRVRVWTDGELALWAEAAERAPTKPRPWINLGRQYQIRHQYVDAEHAYRMAIQAAIARPESPDESRIGQAYGGANLVTVLLMRQDGMAEAKVIVADLERRYPRFGMAHVLHRELLSFPHP